MTALLPSTQVRVDSAAISELHDALPTCTVDELVAIKLWLTDFMSQLRLAAKEAESEILERMGAMGQKRLEVPGLAFLEVRRSMKRSSWRSQDLLHDVIEAALTEVPLESVVNPETGEVTLQRNPYEVASTIARAVNACAPLTPSTAWRVRALLGYGLTPADYCFEEPDHQSLQITS